MERTRNDNVNPPSVEEEANAASNWGQNQEREKSLKECWKLAIRDDYLAMRRKPITTNNFELKPSPINLVQSIQLMDTL